MTPTPSKRPVSPLTFEDLTADLAWPKLLRAGPLAVRPARLGLAFVYLIGLFIILFASKASLSPSAAEALGAQLSSLGNSLTNLNIALSKWNAAEAGSHLYNAFILIPAQIMRAHPIVTIIDFPLLLIWTAVIGGTISRTAATEFCAGVSLSWPQALGFAITKWKALTGALLIPLLIIWAIAFVLAVAGWALFSFPILNVLGGLLYPLFLIGALIAAIVIIAYAIGHAMLIPSVTVEGTDAIDAVQHAYSFVFARPLRLVLYIWILIIQMALVAFVAGLVVWLTVHFASTTAAAWSGEHGANVLSHQPNLLTTQPAFATESLPRSDRYAFHLTNFWTAIPIGLFFAFLVSYFWSASTLLYLAMRRITDGQDMTEVWMPTMVEGTLASVTTAKAAASKAPENVTDNGPADET